MANNVNDFINAIIGQESGGHYGSVNSSSGALGRYQIMPANISNWSMQALGHSITPQEFLASPSLQDQIGRFMLTRAYNAYGPRGAAANWYSGNPKLSESTAPQPGGPSVKGYVDSVMARMMGPTSPNYVAGLNAALGGAGDVLKNPAAGTVIEDVKNKAATVLDSVPNAITGFGVTLSDIALRMMTGALGVGLIILGFYLIGKPQIKDAAGKIAMATAKGATAI